jgi:Spy/CpxP family protein refolding chaperone
MNRTALILSGIAAAALLGSAALLAPATADNVRSGNIGFRGLDAGGFGGPGMRLLRIADQLDFTPEQREQLGAILDESAPQLREFAFAMMDDRRALHELVMSGSYDEATVRQIADQAGDRIAEMIVTGTRAMASMRALLTEEQLARLEALEPRFGEGLDAPGPH